MRSPLAIHAIFATILALVALPFARRAWLGTLDEGIYMVMVAILGFIVVGWFASVQTFRIWWVPPVGRSDPGTPRRRR